MKITINGRSRELPEEMDLNALIAQFCADSRNVVAELNGAIIRQDAWPQRTVKDGDSIELVNIVGGG